MPAFSLPSTPPVLTVWLLRPRDAPLLKAEVPFSHPVASVADLAPLYCRRKITRPVSYYALFQGWLLLSQPPGCLSNLTSFTTQSALGDLS